MKLSRYLLPLLLAMALLLAQQGGATHSLIHALAKQTQQDKHLPQSSPCEQCEVYAQLEQKAEMLARGVVEAASAAGVALSCNRVGSMFTWFFKMEKIFDWTSAEQSDTGAFAKFHRGMLENGMYLPPSQFEAAFLSAAHTDENVRVTVDAAKAVLKSF